MSIKIPKPLETVAGTRKVLFSDGLWFIVEPFPDSKWKSYVYHSCTIKSSPYWIIPWDTKVVKWKCNVCKKNLPDSISSLWTLQNFDALGQNCGDEE